VRRPDRLVAALVTGVLAVPSLAGCVGLPSDGPVRTRGVGNSGEGDALVDYTPPRPKAGSGPLRLVDGWLTAMTATPLSTLVARAYLTADSSRSWVPERGTVVYGSQQILARPGGVVMLRLRDVVELDDRGTWRGDPTAGRGRDLTLRLVREHGQWRIARPPDRLLIPRTQLDTQYQQLSLYFFDRAAKVLVPEPVYVPRGAQAPTLLLTGLLRGPLGRLKQVERTFFPAGSALDGISVPVARNGTVEVPLTDPVLDADDHGLASMFAQLAWTLGQVPGGQRLRVTVDGTPISLPGSGEVVGVDDFSRFDPSIAWASFALFGVRDRRVVTLGTDGEERVSGPFGTLGLDPRWIAVDPLAQRVAGVSRDGRTVLDSDRDAPPGRPARASDLRTVYPGGTAVLRPVYDLYGHLWVVDRTVAGARLSVVAGGTPAPVDAPGLTGADVSRFLVSRDGTRVVAEVRRAGQDRLVVARVRRDTRGRVLGLQPAETLRVEGAPAVISDVAWRTPTHLAVLVAPSRGVSDVLLAAIDGSSTGTELLANAARFRGPAVRLVTSPSEGTPLYVASPTGRLYALSSRGQWTDSGIAPGLEAATFVG
jgi:hypothetical protein